ncbi:NACHT N-terminal Helical domain 1-containing protein [Streptomyces acidicola]
MEPASAGVRLASSVVAPPVRKLFVVEGAGLVDRPVRIAGFVSFKGEKRTLTRPDLHKLCAELVKRALKDGERPIYADHPGHRNEAQRAVIRLSLLLPAGNSQAS